VQLFVPLGGEETRLHVDVLKHPGGTLLKVAGTEIDLNVTYELEPAKVFTDEVSNDAKGRPIHHVVRCRFQLYLSQLLVCVKDFHPALSLFEDLYVRDHKYAAEWPSGMFTSFRDPQPTRVTLESHMTECTVDVRDMRAAICSRKSVLLSCSLE
jgi:hypothetical protein